MPVRLWPLTISRYRETRETRQTPSETAAPTPRPERRQLGAFGTTFFAGILHGVEYNTKLVGAEGLATWKRIFSSDGTARAIERAVTLPIRAAQMRIVPVSDQARDVEIAEAVEGALRGMQRSWESSLWHQLLYLRYGFYLFELIWKYDGSRYLFHDLAPRPPGTVYRWYIEETGELAGVQQRVWTPTTAGYGVLSQGEYKYLDIPAVKLLHLVNEGEAGNVQGESIARPMYKHWLMAETIEKVMAIGVERREIGAEYAQMGADAQVEDQDAVAAALASLHANEKAYIVFPPTVTDKGIFGQGVASRSSALQYLEYHKREMARSYLAEFLQMGADASGSRAMHRDKSSFFTLGLKSVADYLADAHGRGTIKPFVDVNFGPQAEYPRMEFSRLETRNIQEYADAIQKLVNVGALTADRVTEEALRADLDMPELAEDTERPEEKPEPPPPPMPVPPGGPATGPPPGGQQPDEDANAETEEGPRQNTRRPFPGVTLRALSVAEDGLVARLQTSAAAAEARGVALLTQYFQGIRNRADGVMGSHMGTRSLAAPYPFDENDLIPQAADAELAEGWNERVTRILLAATWDDVNDSALAGRVVFQPQSETVLRLLDDAGARMTTVNDTTRAALRAALRDGISRGYSVQQVANGVPADVFPGVRQLLEDTYKGRAVTIVRTEVSIAQNQAAVARYELAGVTHVDVSDGDQDAPCAAVAGTRQTVAWARANPIGHPRCVRSFLPVTELHGR